MKLGEIYPSEEEVRELLPENSKAAVIPENGSGVRVVRFNSHISTARDYESWECGLTGARSLYGGQIKIVSTLSPLVEAALVEVRKAQSAVL